MASMTPPSTTYEIYYSVDFMYTTHIYMCAPNYVAFPVRKHATS